MRYSPHFNKTARWVCISNVKRPLARGYGPDLSLFYLSLNVLEVYFMVYKFIFRHINIDIYSNYNKNMFSLNNKGLFCLGTFITISSKKQYVIVKLLLHTSNTAWKTETSLCSCLNKNVYNVCYFTISKKLKQININWFQAIFVFYCRSLKKLSIKKIVLKVSMNTLK